MVYDYLAEDTRQAQLKRMALHFEEEGLYVKAGYCWEIIDYINELEQKVKDNVCRESPT